jgi:hypothetical protein
MLTGFESGNFLDADGNPAGGFVSSTGLQIEWQNGPLGRGEDRLEPNGAFVETVIAAAKQRLEYYQESKFNCEENRLAIELLNDALEVLNQRTKRREEQAVEGTHEGN